jgi:hypothetical protein
MEVSVCFRPRPLYPWGKAHGNHWIGGWVDPRTSVHDAGRRKILPLPGLGTPIPRPSYIRKKKWKVLWKQLQIRAVTCRSEVQLAIILDLFYAWQYSKWNCANLVELKRIVTHIHYTWLFQNILPYSQLEASTFSLKVTRNCLAVYVMYLQSYQTRQICLGKKYFLVWNIHLQTLAFTRWHNEYGLKDCSHLQTWLRERTLPKSVKLTTHHQLVSRSRMRGSIHPLRHAPSWRCA